MKPHYNENGEICNCGFGRYNEPTEENLVKEAGAKLDWIRDREDKFFKTEEGQLAFDWLSNQVGANEKVDPLAPWLWRELKKGRINPTRNFWPANELAHAADWYASNSPTRRGVDIMQLTLPDVVARIKEWDEELKAEMDTAQVEGGRIVEDLGDGWTIRQITDKNEAQQEGDAMGHCVGSYGNTIERGGVLIYSLRDPQNKPHATIEIDPPSSSEFYGDIDEDDDLRAAVDKQLAELAELQKTKNFVDTHFKVLKAMIDGGASNEQVGETIANLIEDKDIEYKEFVQVFRETLDGTWKDRRADILSQISPEGGKVIQIQGKENKMPVEKYREPIGNWLLSFMDPPNYVKSVEYVHIEAPGTTNELRAWIDPYTAYDYNVRDPFEYSDYDYIEVDPASFEDYFPSGQDHGYLHNEEGGLSSTEIDRAPIDHDCWRQIVISALVYSGMMSHPDVSAPNLNEEGVAMSARADAPEKLLELVDKAEKIYEEDENLSRYVGPKELFPDAVKDLIEDEFYPEFKTREFDPTSYLSEAQQWARLPVYQYLDQLLGYNYVDPTEPDPTEVSPEQNVLFGPGVTETWQIQKDKFQKQLEDSGREDLAAQVPDTPLPNAPNLKRDVPWNDPTNIDNMEGKFGKLLKRLFRRRANILDEVHSGLDPAIWDNPNHPRPILKSEIANWVTKSVIGALARNGYTHIDEWMSLVITGSLTTYQYSLRSDFDVSVFVDAEVFPEWSRAEMISILMDECDGIAVPGTMHPLQCYVVSNEFTKTDLYQPGLRSAYDINASEWIVAPEKDRSHNVKHEMNEAYTIALENADKMEKLIRYEPLKAVQFYGQVHRRRRRDMQQGGGDFSPSNITYKMMEDRGLFDQVKSITKEYKIK